MLSKLRSVVVNFLLKKLLKQQLDKLPGNGKKTIVGVLVLLLSFLAGYVSPESQATLEEALTWLRTEAADWSNVSVAELFQAIGGLLVAIGLSHKGLKFMLPDEK